MKKLVSQKKKTWQDDIWKINEAEEQLAKLQAHVDSLKKNYNRKFDKVLLCSCCRVEKKGIIFLYEEDATSFCHNEQSQWVATRWYETAICFDCHEKVQKEKIRRIKEAAERELAELESQGK